VRRLLKEMLFFSLAFLLACSDGEEIVGTNGDMPPPPPANVIRVPQDQPTIQAGIDAAQDGDTVRVADGLYQGVGNRDIEFGGKAMVVISQNGPGETVIACQGTEDENHFGFVIDKVAEGAVVIDGFTIRDAYHTQGSAVDLRSVAPVIRNCIFINNTSIISGGAMRCKAASPIVQNCTFVGNSAPVGAVVYMRVGSMPRFINCIMALSTGGEVVECSGDEDAPDLSCCDVFDNEAGDWTGCISEMMTTGGNMSVDPAFCSVADNDFRLQPASPCAAANNDCGVDIGALGTGCSP
jgi:hypothetical protein